MKRSLVYLACLSLLAGVFPTTSVAQSLYMPRNVKAAVARGTRTTTGAPGAAYWQNHARYTMTVTVMPPDRRVSGTERIAYFNDSPDTLPGLVLKLFQNYHKAGAPRMSGTSEDFLTSGMHIDAVEVNGKTVEWRDNPRTFTTASMHLPAPVMPGDSVALSFTWYYDVSKQPGREGMIDPTTYYLAYFYPRVAVYDDTDGWDRMDHTGHEFYSDFNDYDVSVQVPAGFLVWGTGDLETAPDVLQPTYLKRYQTSLTSDSTVRIATEDELAAGGVTVDAPLNVWRFTSRNVPDVAFGVSDHYDWDAGSVVVDPSTGRRAGVQAAYADAAADFHHMVRFGRDALAWFSTEWPGVPYPYAKTSIFEGGAGMEYPMMVNDGSYPDTAMARFVAGHEIAHTYMPFYMGIDETRYAFMDEGWATTFEYLIGTAQRGKAFEDRFFETFRVNRWIHDASAAADLPIITPADELTGAYGNNAYGKAALGYLAMKDLLGDALFKKCLQTYMDRWHGKHPTPWDFFYTYDDVAGRSLDWFWRSWFFENSYIDLAVTEARKTADGYAVKLADIGGMPAPVDLLLTYQDGSTQTLHQTPAIWQADAAKATVPVRTSRTLKSVSLEHGIWMDADTSNDTWKSQ